MKSVVLAVVMGFGLLAIIFVQREAKKRAYAERLRTAPQRLAEQTYKFDGPPGLNFSSEEEARDAYEIVLRELGAGERPALWVSGHDHTNCLRILDYHRSRQEIENVLAGMVVESADQVLVQSISYSAEN
ncbi:hypothetical protein [Pelagicoccus mobilis]|uniref:Uncharacterized protein n=1 Tax=Pelagicoccus mobilis TaxID=415221 RepID=A0A934VPA2_9BACT|nr:hypothetical protein [Pelagicoccus mobilis]MBK1877072.1 hypothetical protein [Pelagicoccus mobilis]